MTSKIGILFTSAVLGLIAKTSASPVISGSSSSFASSGSYAGASQYGSGQYASGGVPAPIPPIPIQPLPAQPFDYGQLQSKYFETVAKHFQHSRARGLPHYVSSSSASLALPTSDAQTKVLNEQFAAQHAAIQQSLQQAIQQAQAQGAGQGYGSGGQNYNTPLGGASGSSPSSGGAPPYQIGGGSGGSFPGEPVAALAAASLGPQGGYQIAQLTPANPNSPNVEQRFGSGGGTQPGGSYSVFTSSVSGSSDINGKKDTFRKAQTTINDNGKVTTYTVQDP